MASDNSPSQRGNSGSGDTRPEPHVVWGEPPAGRQPVGDRIAEFVSTRGAENSRYLEHLKTWYTMKPEPPTMEDRLEHRQYEAVDEVEDAPASFPGAVVGYRAMRLQPQGMGAPLLTSLTSRTMGGYYGWNPTETSRATCVRHENHNEHEGEHLPAASCMCGFWAFEDYDELTRQEPATTDKVHFLVAGWGKVLTHERGFRSEYARPLAAVLPDSLTVNEKSVKRVRHMLRMLEVPIYAPRDLPRLADAYGLSTMRDFCAAPISAAVYYQWLTSSGDIVLAPANEKPEPLAYALPVAARSPNMIQAVVPENAHVQPIAIEPHGGRALPTSGPNFRSIALYRHVLSLGARGVHYALWSREPSPHRAGDGHQHTLIKFQRIAAVAPYRLAEHRI